MPAAVLTTLEGTGKKTSKARNTTIAITMAALEASAFSKLLYFRTGGFLEEEEWNQDHSKEQSNDGGPRAHNPR